MHHTKGRRRDLVERAKKKGIFIITFDGGILSSLGNTITDPNHHWRVALYSPMNNGNFLSDNSPPDRWEHMKKILEGGATSEAVLNDDNIIKFSRLKVATK